MIAIEQRLVNLLTQRGFYPSLEYGRNGYWTLTFPYELDGEIQVHSVNPETRVSDLWFLDDGCLASPVKPEDV